MPELSDGVSLSTNVDAFVIEAALGPDALNPAFTSSNFASILANSNRDVKSNLEFNGGRQRLRR